MSHALFRLLPTSLATLQLTSNSFAALPEDFFLTRPVLHSFDLGRGFADPPDHVVSAGRAAISEYFAAKRLDGSERMSNLRLMLVGRGGVGKTSLFNALRSP
jgi:predicted GTPase